MNKVILLGRLTATPELKQTQSGVAVTSATIAVNRQFVKAGEERQADFIPIVAWRHNAEFLCKYFSKGQQLSVVGSLQNREWTDKDGVNRRTSEVIVDEMYFAEAKRESGEANAYSPKTYTPPTGSTILPVTATTRGVGVEFLELSEDGELPF